MMPFPKTRIVVLLIVLVLTTILGIGLASMRAAGGQTPPSDQVFQYSVKLACVPGLGGAGKSLTPKSMYRTTVNILNPSQEPAPLTKWVVLSPLEPATRSPSTPVSEALGPYEAFQVHCDEAKALLGQMAPVSGGEGWLILQSPTELDVAAVYTARRVTANKNGTGLSIDVEYIQPRLVHPVPPAPTPTPLPSAVEKLVFFNNAAGQLWTVNSDGTDLTRILTDDPNCVMLPRWSPNGQEIAFMRSPDCGSSLVIVNADGTGAMELDWFGEYPAWSPDGMTLVYRCTFTAVCLRLADGSGMPTTLFDFATVGMDGVGPMDWHPDGSAIAVSVARPGGDWSIWTINPDAADPQPSAVIDPGPGIAWLPRYSPDGARLAYAFCPATTGCGWSLHVANANGTGDQPLNTSIDNALPGSWSPHGDRIYFSDAGGLVGVYSIRPDGSDEQQITTFGAVPDATAGTP